MNKTEVSNNGSVARVFFSEQVLQLNLAHYGQDILLSTVELCGDGEDDYDSD